MSTTATRQFEPRQVRRPSAAVSATGARPNLAQHLGNQSLQRLLRARLLQAKLTISDPRDVYEQEADRVADQVMRMQAPVVPIAGSSGPVVQRVCKDCEEQLQRAVTDEDSRACSTRR